MSEKSKHKRNLNPRGFKEIIKSHSRFEPPPGEFKDLFREMETSGNNRPSGNIRRPKSDNASR